MKPDFTPLLPAGMHSLSWLDVYTLAVKPFTLDVQRQDLYLKLKCWVDEVKALGVVGTLWIDGSFMTIKPGPADIDCVLWHPSFLPGVVLTPDQRQKLDNLFDHDAAKTKYGLDLYLESPLPDQLFHSEAYWRGVLGFARDRVTAKGFAEVLL